MKTTDVYPDSRFCDDYTADRYERPIPSDASIYYAYVDIERTYIGEDATWFYFLLDLAGTNGSGELSGQYGFELDFDLDHRGDFFIRNYRCFANRID